MNQQLLGQKTIESLIDGKLISYPVTVSSHVQAINLETGEAIGEPIPVSVHKPGTEYCVTTSKGSKFYFTEAALVKALAKDDSGFVAVRV